jgi:LmbE family N-acetylglucosaminyl deacetylase
MEPAAPLLVVSPHLDDGVLSCGTLLAARPGAVVLTLFAGTPANATQLTDWDRAAGFDDAREAVAARRQEDAAALAVLGAQPLWFDFTDAQYGQPRSADAVAAALEVVVAERQPASVLVPMGLFHEDHTLAHDAALRVMRRRPLRAESWYAYEDVPYRRLDGWLQRRLARLAVAGVTATPVALSAADPAPKQHALQCYASQLRALATPGRPGHADATAPEGCWHLRLFRR